MVMQLVMIFFMGWGLVMFSFFRCLGEKWSGKVLWDSPIQCLQSMQMPRLCKCLVWSLPRLSNLISLWQVSSFHSVRKL